jgi:hypothetical protein
MFILIKLRKVFINKILLIEMDGETSTEVISLSDWMHESTMFNIITNIQFFKNYAISIRLKFIIKKLKYSTFGKLMLDTISIVKQDINLYMNVL